MGRAIAVKTEYSSGELRRLGHKKTYVRFVSNSACLATPYGRLRQAIQDTTRVDTAHSFFLSRSLEFKDRPGIAALF